MRNVDVLIPFHREPDKYLCEAIASVRNSRKINTNIILIDDRKEIRSKLEISPKTTLLVTGGLGYPGSLNLARKELQSEYVAIVNSDDLTHPDRFFKQIESLEKTGEDISITRLLKFSKRMNPRFIFGTQPHGQYQKHFLLLGSFGANASILSRSDQFQKRTWIDSDMADWNYAFRYFPAWNMKSYIDEELYFYRSHAYQITKQKRLRPFWLIPEWNALNSTYNLPAIEPKVISAVGLPFLFTKLDQDELRELFNWISCYLNLIQTTLDAQSCDEIVSILIRRIVPQLKPTLSPKQYISIINYQRYTRELIQIFIDLVLNQFGKYF